MQTKISNFEPFVIFFQYSYSFVIDLERKVYVDGL